MLTFVVVIVVFIGVLYFVPFLRRIVSLFLRIGIFLFATFAAVGGLAMLMNNETIYDRPGASARFHRFLNVNWANTSDVGLGSAPCSADRHAKEAASEEKHAEAKPPKRAKRGKKEAAAEAQPTVAPTPVPTPSVEEDIYPELVTRDYVCGEGEAMPKDRLFQMAQQTITELKGWKIVKADERAGVIDCVYTTRFLGFEDDI